MNKRLIEVIVGRIPGLLECRKDIAKALTLHCPQRPSEDDRFPPCGSLTVSIFHEVAKKNWNNSLKGRGKQLRDTVRKSAPTTAKPQSTASSQDRRRTYGWMDGKVLEEVDQFK